MNTTAGGNPERNPAGFTPIEDVTIWVRKDRGRSRFGNGHNDIESTKIAWRLNMQCCGPENCGRRERRGDLSYERICWEDNTCAAWRWAESEYEDVEAWEEFDLKTRLNTYMTKGEGYHKLVFDPTQGGWEKIEGASTGSRDVALFRRLRIHRKGYCGLAGKPEIFV